VRSDIESGAFEFSPFSGNLEVKALAAQEGPGTPGRLSRQLPDIWKLPVIR
jgi:hypothetical protein